MLHAAGDGDGEIGEIGEIDFNGFCDVMTALPLLRPAEASPLGAGIAVRVRVRVRDAAAAACRSLPAECRHRS